MLADHAGEARTQDWELSLLRRAFFPNLSQQDVDRSCDAKAAPVQCGHLRCLEQKTYLDTVFVETNVFGHVWKLFS